MLKLLRLAYHPFLIFTGFFFIKMILLGRMLYGTYWNPGFIINNVAGIAVLFILLEFLPKKTKWTLYILLDAILTTAFFAIVIYSNYFENVPTYHDLSSISQIPSVNSNLGLLIHPQEFLLYFDFIILIILMLFHFFLRTKITSAKRYSRKWLSVGLAGLLAFNIGSYFYHRTDQVLNSAVYAKTAGLINLQFNQLHTERAVQAMAKKGSFNLTQDKIFQIKHLKRVPSDQHPYFGIAKGRNLIVIQMESLQNMIIGKSINGQEITPNLNKLLKESFYFNNVYQQIGSGNTSDAEFLMNTSLYPVGNNPTSETYGNRVIPSLARLLKDNGYQAVTLHVDDIHYWNRDELYPALGFDKHYDKSYFGEEDKVGLGASDDVLYTKGVDALEALKTSSNKPFYADFVTLSAHTPFQIPKDKQTLSLPKKYQGTFFGNYLEAQHYADAALGRFFDLLKEKGLWDKSMIVIYGDHSGVHGKLMQKQDQQLVGDFLKHPYTLLDRFNIPFIIAIPGVTHAKIFENAGGQIDMMPTVINLLGINDQNMVLFGQDLTEYKDNLFGMRYYLTAGAYFTQHTFYIPDSERTHLVIYNRLTHQMIAPKDQKAYEDKSREMLKLLELSDQYMARLPYRK
jgi:phosphoglycerol transferase MdoB-like AlkP superfamily enzyme